MENMRHLRRGSTAELEALLPAITGGGHGLITFAGKPRNCSGKPAKFLLDLERNNDFAEKPRQELNLLYAAEV